MSKGSKKGEELALLGIAMREAALFCPSLSLSLFGCWDTSERPVERKKESAKKEKKEEGTARERGDCKKEEEASSSSSSSFNSFLLFRMPNRNPEAALSFLLQPVPPSRQSGATRHVRLRSRAQKAGQSTGGHGVRTRGGASGRRRRRWQARKEEKTPPLHEDGFQCFASPRAPGAPFRAPTASPWPESCRASSDTNGGGDEGGGGVPRGGGANVD